VCQFGCDHNQMNQHDYFAKKLWRFFSVLMTFTYKAILNEIFCNLLLKIFIIFLMHQIFYAYFF